MSKPDDKIGNDYGEALHPVHSAAVRWSFGLGFAALVALVIVSHLAAN
jgi:hypothetical protein